MSQNKRCITLATIALLGSTVAQAALHDRGGGLIYDDVLNVTWLQDANYAKSSGLANDGRMDWESALAWSANLNYYDSVRDVVLSDWRLPKTLPVNGVNYIDFVGYGNSDIGYNVSAPGSSYPGSTGSELAYMFYVNLMNQGNYAPSGALVGCSPGCLSNRGPFLNIATYQYWSSTSYTGNSYSGENAWYVDAQDGFQGAYVKT